MTELGKTEEGLFQGLIERSLITWFVFTTLGIIAVYYRADITGWGVRETIQAVLWFGTLLLVMFRNKLSVKYKAGYLTVMLTIFALMGVFSLGFMAAALHFIPLTGIMLLLFFPSKLAEKYYLFALGLIASAALLFIFEWVTLPFDANELITSWQHWILVLLCFTFYVYFSTTALLLYKNESKALLKQLELKNLRLKDARFTDFMTGLPMLEKGGLIFSEKVMAWKESGNKKAAVMYLDLDEFKVINEVYGHDAGDWCIKEVSRRLENIIEGHGFVMRIGSDEFMMVYVDFSLKTHAVTFATEVLACIQEPISLEHVNLKLNSSIGISFYPEDGQSLSELRRRADLAMYQAKVDENLSISTYKSATS